MNIDTTGKLHMGITDLLGESVAVLGIKGSGKSNTTAALCEEMLSAGLPMVIVDIAGEYWGLKERYQILVAGKSSNVDLEVDVDGAAALAAYSLQNKVPTILDLSGWRRSERMPVVSAYLETLWDLAGDLRRPYHIILEEAHNFIPQSGNTDVSEILVMIATEGRKRGLGIVMVGQRSARIDKDVLSQAGILMLHRVRHPADVGVYQDILPAERKWVKAETAKLSTGEALVLFGDDVIRAAIRKRHTYHAGYTPGLDETEAPALRRVDDAMLSELRDALKSRAQSGETGITAAEKRIEALEGIIEEKDAEIAGLQKDLDSALAQVRMLSRLKVIDERPRSEAVQMALPSMAVQQADVAQVRLNGMVAAPVAEAVAEVELETDTQPTTAEPYRSELAVTRAYNAQERQFNRFLLKLQTLPAHHLKMLQYLTHSGAWMTEPELIAKLGYSASTVERNRPGWLRQEGVLVMRGKRGHTKEWRSRLAAYLVQIAPDHEVRGLIDQVMKLR
jgi:hypothetical protein